MSNADPRTVEQIVLPIAEREGPCPKPWVSEPSGRVAQKHPKACTDCHGTGQAARFPGLREPCPCLAGTQRCLGCLTGDAGVIALLGPTAPPAHPDKFCDPPCTHCQGRGWLPVVTTDALLEAVWYKGLVVIWWSEEEVRLQRPGFHHEVFVGRGSNNLALSMALEAALQKEAKP